MPEECLLGENSRNASGLGHFGTARNGAGSECFGLPQGWKRGEQLVQEEYCVVICNLNGLTHSISSGLEKVTGINFNIFYLVYPKCNQYIKLLFYVLSYAKFFKIHLNSL